MGTPIHGEVDPTVKKQPCLSKHYAHTTKLNVQACAIKKRVVFLLVPYRFSRFHATANIQHPMHTPVHT